MKRLLKLIPETKLDISTQINLPLSKKDTLNLSKKNLLLNGSKKDLNTFIIQSIIYLSLSYDMNDLNIYLIDFNSQNKPLYKLSSLDTINSFFLEPDAVDLSIFLDNVDKDKRSVFFIFEDKDLLSYPDYEFILKDSFSELLKNTLFTFITMYEGDKRDAGVNTLSETLNKTKFALEKDFIPDFFLKINQDINEEIVSVSEYRRNRSAYIKNKRLI